MRLKATSRDLKLGISDEDICLSIKAAVFLANKDVLGFAGIPELSDAGLRSGNDTKRLQDHLQGTWALIPESNPDFRNLDRDAGNYSPRKSREDLSGRRGFLRIFSDSKVQQTDSPAKQIFHQYGGYPPQRDFDTLKKQEKTVRDNAASYLEAKSVSAAFVEAIATMSGFGETRISDLVSGIGERLHTHEATVRREDPVFTVLKEGRGKDNNAPAFDITDSPIATFIVSRADTAAARGNSEETGIEAVKDIYARFLTKPKQFSDPQKHKAFLLAVRDRIGQQAFQEIVDQMIDIARNSGNNILADRIGMVTSDGYLTGRSMADSIRRSKPDRRTPEPRSRKPRDADVTTTQVR
jgi:hypothetical protein